MSKKCKACGAGKPINDGRCAMCVNDRIDDDTPARKIGAESTPIDPGDLTAEDMQVLLRLADEWLYITSDQDAAIDRLVKMGLATAKYEGGSEHEFTSKGMVQVDSTRRYAKLTVSGMRLAKEETC